jgi:hypothetical protein
MDGDPRSMTADVYWKAITAMARKLACPFYRLLTKGQQYPSNSGCSSFSHKAKLRSPEQWFPESALATLEQGAERALEYF